MGFKLDDKITWIELAPSVQDDFRNQNKNIINERTARITADNLIQGRLDQERIDMEAQANSIKNLINTLAGNGDYDSRVTDLINDNTSEPTDKFVKVNKTAQKLFVDDNFREAYVVVNNDELTLMKNSEGVNLIYSLHTDQVFEFNNIDWVVKGTCTDLLPNRIFLYNNKLWNFYFYYYPGKWQKINGKE